MILGRIKLEPSVVDIVKTPPQTFLPLRGDTRRWVLTKWIFQPESPSCEVSQGYEPGGAMIVFVFMHLQSLGSVDLC